MPAFQVPSQTVNGALSAAGILTTLSGKVIANRVVTAVGAVTVTSADDWITVNKSVGAATTVNLPGSPTTGQTFTIHDGKGDAATNALTITPAAGTINGAATLVLNTAYASAICTYNGTQWDATVILASSGGGVTSVTGTAPIVSSGGTTPAISITSPLPTANGGTGIASPTAHSLLAANGASAMNLIAPGTTGNFLVSNGTDFAGRTIASADLTTALTTPPAIGATTPSTIKATTINATGILTTASGQIVAERVITAAGAITVATTDYMVTVNKTVGAASAVSLPGSPVTGTTFVIHDGKGDAATNNITITPAAGTINGAATLVLNTAYATTTLTYNGTQWDAIVSGSGTGTVTSVTGTAPIISSGGTTPAISITTPIAANYGGTGITSPTANSLLAGNGASAANLIAPGTAGNVLASNGTVWAGSNVYAPYSLAQGRLTLVSGTPQPTTDVTGATTVYWTPYNGNQIGLYDGSANWVVRAFAETSLSLSGLAANAVYDIFAFDSAGTLALESLAWNLPTSAAITAITNASPPVASTGTTPVADQLVAITGNNVAANNGLWRVGTVVLNTSFQMLKLDGTNPTAPGSVGTGATWSRRDAVLTRGTALVLQSGILVKSGATTRRYLGSVWINPTAGQTDVSSATRIGLWNYYNRTERSIKAISTSTSWSYSSATLRAANNDFGIGTASNEVLIGYSEDIVEAYVKIEASAASAINVSIGIGTDSRTTNSAQFYQGQASTAPLVPNDTRFLGYLSAGNHYIQWLESTTAAVATTFYSNSAPIYQNGMTVKAKA